MLLPLKTGGRKERWLPGSVVTSALLYLPEAQTTTNIGTVLQCQARQQLNTSLLKQNLFRNCDPAFRVQI
jgi:hypothetical protein